MWGQTASSLSGSAGIVFIDCICIRRRNGKLDVGVERWVGRSPLTPLTVLPRPQCQRHLGEEKTEKNMTFARNKGPHPPGGISKCLDRVPAWLQSGSGLGNLTTKCYIHSSKKSSDQNHLESFLYSKTYFTHGLDDLVLRNRWKWLNWWPLEVSNESKCTNRRKS